MNAPSPLPNYVQGRWQRAAGQEALPVINPATGEVLSSVPLSGAADVDQAVTGARDAFQGWRETPATEGGGPFVWPHDLVSTAFYLLSRREELDETRRDDMLRFDASHSRLQRLGLADRPILNTSIERLKRAVSAVATARQIPALRVSRWPHPHRWAACLSHDIDDLGLRDARFALQRRDLHTSR